MYEGVNLPSERITVIMVTYNSESLITDALLNLRHVKAIIVVDNASSDHSVDKVRSVAPHARIITNARNEGFGRAANRALNKVNTEFALLVAPDCLIGGEVIEHLLMLADRWENAAMVSPLLVDGDGTLARCHDHDLFSRQGLRRNRGDEPFPSGNLCAGFVQNSTALMRMKAVKQIGFYDERIFLFYEDDDLCIRLRDRGWSLILTPEVSAKHFSGASSNMSPRLLTRRRYYHMAWSRGYLEQKYKGRTRGLTLSVTRLGVFFGKLIFAILFLNKWKMVRDSARLLGTAGYLLGFSAYRSEEKNK